ncbi:putative out at first protein [Apostichopus japonicus]|uniref:Putative out at first protein n=1 Tax=Stichopus japonicus TaxID=307972 RepID=A0A2G8KLE8_STIJA|nr:putative out at first protein [Apostichopus japonicus]
MMMMMMMIDMMMMMMMDDDDDDDDDVDDDDGDDDDGDDGVTHCSSLACHDCIRGDLIQETIQADIAQDIIHMEFQKLDGTLIKIILDFRSEVQITRLTILGEEERNEKLYQRLCFVNQFSKSSFISTDAMSKLRQKNPGTIRNPEDDLGREQLQMDMSINLERASRISKHIRDICSEARTTTYTREEDLKLWSKEMSTPDGDVQYHLYS